MAVKQGTHVPQSSTSARVAREEQFLSIARDDPDYVPFRTLLQRAYLRLKRPLLVAETGAEGEHRGPWFRYVADEVAAAGVLVSAALLLLGLTGLVDWAGRHVPRSVVRGLQLALGLALVGKGARMVGTPGDWLAGAAAALVVAFFLRSRRVPAALLLGCYIIHLVAESGEK